MNLLRRLFGRGKVVKQWRVTEKRKRGYKVRRSPFGPTVIIPDDEDLPIIKVRGKVPRGKKLRIRIKSWDKD
jgi:hypothetical protein